MSEVLAWIANLLFVFGACLVANRNRAGFVVLSVANALYVVFSALTGSLALAALSLTLVWINVVGFLKWRKADV